MLCNKGCGSGKNRLLLVPSSEHDNQSGALFSSIQNGPLDVVQWRTPFKAKDESTIANGQSAIVSRLHLAFFLDVINPSIDIGEERIKLHSAKKKKTNTTRSFSYWLVPPQGAVLRSVNSKRAPGRYANVGGKGEAPNVLRATADQEAFLHLFSFSFCVLLLLLLLLLLLSPISHSFPYRYRRQKKKGQG